MKLLRGYILKELVTPFCVSLLIFTFVFIVGHLVTKMAELIISKGVSILDILRIVVLLIPRLLSYTIPTSALASILLVFGSMAQQNEIVAMKASGINLVRLLVPVVLVSILLSLCSLIMNDQILPKTHFAYRKAVQNLLVKQPLAFIEAGRFIKEFERYIIFVREIEGNVLKNITIYEPREDEPTRTIIAEWGQIITNQKTKAIAFELYNGSYDEPDPNNPKELYKAEFKKYVLPPFSMAASGQLSKKTTDMTIDELVYKLQDKDEIKNIVQKTNLKQRLKAEIHKKIAFSFAPFVFTVVGLPLALITRRGEIVISFALAMAVITVYYVLFAWANTIAIQGVLTPWTALWLPNVLLLIVGTALMAKYVNV